MRYSVRNQLAHLTIATALVAIYVLITAPVFAAAPKNKAHSPLLVAPSDGEVQRGKYLIKIMGCNDCHTPGYAQAAGKVPESAWLTGDSLGYKGPWGTTYPTNLRLLFNGMSKSDWMKYAKSVETRPPMPWFNMRALSDRDLGALYAYMKALGPAGQPAPAYVPPAKQPAGPVIRWPE